MNTIPIPIDWTNATDNLLTTGSGRFDGGVGVGADPTVISLLNITSSHADRTAIRINNTSTGNPVVQFALSSTVKYTMGIDDSDGDKFKISSGTTLGAPTLIMDSAINLSGIGTITSSGAYNTLHIVEGTTASHPVWANYACLSGDGTEHDGLSIQIPYTAGNDFYYGYGGTEDHYFGQSSDLQITSDGNIATAGTIGCGTITATANSDVLLSGTGHITSGSEGFIVGTLTITDGSIDDTDGSIALGDTNLTGVGTIDSGAITIGGEKTSSFTGITVNPTLNPASADQGFTGLNFTLLAVSSSENITGLVGVQGTAGTATESGYTGTIAELIGVSASVSTVGNLLTTDPNFTNAYLFKGDWTDGAGPYTTTTTNAYGLYLPAITAGDTLNYAIYSAGGLSYHAGQFLFGDKALFTQVDGNEYIDSLADGYMDYGATTGHRFNTDKLVVLVTGRVGIGTATPNAPLEVKGAKPAGNIGGFQSGMLHVTGTGTAEFSNSVITGHSAYDTNTQLWYLGSITDANNNIAFINRQNAAMCFYTNNADRMIIDAAGNVGINETAPQDKLEVNGTVLVKDKLKFTQDDGNEYIDSLNDGYVDIGATTAIRLNGLDDTADPKLIFVSDNEGSVTWMEDERYFLLDNALVAVRDDWIPPYISLQSTLSIAQSGGYTPMFESRMDTDGADVETRLESTDALGRVGTNSAHDLDLITNSVARMTVSAAGYVRVINRMMIGADAAPDYPLEVTGISRLGDGGATNYTQFAADGTQTMAGTATVIVSETFTFNYTNITAQGKPTLVNQGVFFGFSLPLYAADEELFACRCIDGDWDGTTDPVIYIGGWLDTANDTKKFQLQVSVETADYAANDVVPVTTNDYPVETTTGTWAQFTSFKVAFTIDASAIGLVAEQPLAIRIRRIAATADEIAGEVVVEGAAITYTADKLGT